MWNIKALLSLILFVVSCHQPCLASRLPTLSTVPPASLSSQQSKILRSIPRGGSLSKPQTVAAAGLSCLAGECLFNLIAPKTHLALYGLDESDEINSLYMARNAGWGLSVALSFLLQFYTKLPFLKITGYSFLPVALLTLVQLLTGRYERSHVNPNSGIAALFFLDVHFAICFLAHQLPEKVPKIWISLYMSLIGISGLNLVISAQAIPSINASTITMLHRLGATTSSIATMILAQYQWKCSVEQAVGVMMGVLAVTSIPACLDLRAASKKFKKNTNGFQLCTVFICMEILSAAYLVQS